MPIQHADFEFSIKADSEMLTMFRNFYNAHYQTECDTPIVVETKQ